MLVLNRKANQSIMLGDAIEITVAEIRGGGVRIAIEAPRSVPIFRKEVYPGVQRDRAPQEDAAESE
jgi:carbon storage regulator